MGTRRVVWLLLTVLPAIYAVPVAFGALVRGLARWGGRGSAGPPRSGDPSD